MTTPKMFDRLNMRDADMRGLDLRLATFGACDLRRADFTGALLNGAIFNMCNLRGAILPTNVQHVALFHLCNMHGVRYAGSTPPVPSQGQARPAGVTQP